MNNKYEPKQEGRLRLLWPFLVSYQSDARTEVGNPCPEQERVSDAPIHRSWTAKVNARVRAASIAPDSRGRELPSPPLISFLIHILPLSLSDSGG